MIRLLDRHRNNRIKLCLILMIILMTGCMGKTKESSETAGEEVPVAEVPASNETPAPVILEHMRSLSPGQSGNENTEDAENLTGFLQDKSSGMMVQIQAGNRLGSGVLVQQDEMHCE